MSTPSYPPMYNGQPAHTAADPYGFRPWNRRVALEGKRLVLSCESRELREWHWPLLNGVRVPPSDLQAVFQTHNVRGPGCLCSLQDPNPDSFTEAAVFFVTSGRLKGEYAAACAKRRCKYWVLIERLYTRRGLPVREYPPREPGAPVPATVTSVDNSSPPSSTTQSQSSTPQPSSSQASIVAKDELPDIEVPPLTLLTTKEEEIDLPLPPPHASTSKVLLGKRKREADKAEDVDTSLVGVEYPPLKLKRKRKDTSPMGLLLLMDSPRGPGITERQFRSLFVKCSSCNKYMTRQVFKIYHHCDIESEDSEGDLGDVIDLTGDDL